MCDNKKQRRNHQYYSTDDFLVDSSANWRVKYARVSGRGRSENKLVYCLEYADTLYFLYIIHADVSLKNMNVIASKVNLKILASRIGLKLDV